MTTSSSELILNTDIKIMNQDVLNYINGFPLVAIIDTGATHSFISLDCAVKLKLEISEMHGSRIVAMSFCGPRS